MFWNRVAGVYDLFVNVVNRKTHRALRRIVAELIGPEDRVLDEPLKALGELNRVCRDGGQLIIPTYMNRDRKGKTSSFASAVGKAGADFKRQFTVDRYRQFFLDAGYSDVRITLAEGRIPCAVAVMTKKMG